MTRTKNQKILLIIVGAVVALPILGIIASIGVAAGKCQAETSKLYDTNKSKFESFNETKIISADDDRQAKITKQSNCLESTPSVYAAKDYYVKDSSDSAYASVQSTLLGQGYSLSEETQSDVNCNKQYRAVATKGNVDIKLTVQENCNDIDSQGYRTRIFATVTAE